MQVSPFNLAQLYVVESDGGLTVVHGAVYHMSADFMVNSALPACFMAARNARLGESVFWKIIQHRSGVMRPHFYIDVVTGAPESTPDRDGILVFDVRNRKRPKYGFVRHASTTDLNHLPLYLPVTAAQYLGRVGGWMWLPREDADTYRAYHGMPLLCPQELFSIFPNIDAKGYM